MRFHRVLDWLTGPLLRLVPRPGPARGILVISAGGLGDTVLFSLVLPRFTALARPGETVTVLLRHDAARMAFVLPPDVRVLAVDFSRLRQPGYRLKIMRQVHQAHFRLVVHTDYLRHPDLDEALVAAADAAEAAAMMPKPSAKHGRRLTANRRLYTRLFDSGPDHLDKVIRWSRFADFLSGQDRPPPLVSLPRTLRPDPVAMPQPTVLFQPFSAVAAKQSPPDLWMRIVRSLPQGWQVLVAGHPSDLDRNPAYRPLLDMPGVRFEGAPFRDVAPVIAGCRLVVSVDTACMHLAVAMGTPTLCLASAAYVGEIVPYAPEITPPNAHVLYQPMECQGCLGNCRHPLQNGMYPCVAALDVGQVVERVAELIK